MPGALLLTPKKQHRVDCLGPQVICVKAEPWALKGGRCATCRKLFLITVVADPVKLARIAHDSNLRNGSATCCGIGSGVRSTDVGAAWQQSESAKRSGSDFRIAPGADRLYPRACLALFCNGVTPDIKEGSMRRSELHSQVRSEYL